MNTSRLQILQKVDQLLTDEPRIFCRLLVCGVRKSGPIECADVRSHMSLVYVCRTVNPSPIVAIEPSMDDQHYWKVKVDFICNLQVVCGNANIRSVGAKQS